MKKIDEELNNVTGGMNGGAIFNASGISGSDANNPWEVLDAKGNVKGRYPTRDLAIYNAGKLDLGFNEVNWNEVQSMRG